MKFLKAQGCGIVLRSAGSHSPIDVIGIHKENKQIVLIQCKPDNFSKKKKDKLTEELSWLNGTFKVDFKVY